MLNKWLKAKRPKVTLTAYERANDEHIGQLDRRARPLDLSFRGATGGRTRFTLGAGFIE